MANGGSIIRIDDLSKPATVLIEKISNAIGGYFKPYQIRRVAKAEAEAEKIRAQAQIKITKLHRRALARFVAEEAKKQDNIEKITAKAIPQLSGSSAPQNMDDDWIANFFDKCRIVSDEEMQLLWARILAGEADSPGTYSKRTVNFLGSLDKVDAQMFTDLCQFVWVSGGPIPLIFDVHASIYTDHGVTFATLTHLDDIGLITFESLLGFRRTKLSQQPTLTYQGTPLLIHFSKPDSNDLDTGKVLFTKTGQELARICGATPIDGFYEYVFEHWSKQGLILSSPTKKSLSSFG